MRATTTVTEKPLTTPARLTVRREGGRALRVMRYALTRREMGPARIVQTRGVNLSLGNGAAIALYLETMLVSDFDASTEVFA